jgi:DNA-binding transcriptional regulator YhcF (GntR family)
MEFKETQAIYLQIGDYISEQILLGRWKEGERIPSVRELGVELQVNPNTVVRTYEFLQNNEIIYNKRGVGYFVSDDATIKIKDLRKKQFLEQELPQFFKTIELLGMNFDEITERYQLYRSRKEK